MNRRSFFGTAMAASALGLPGLAGAETLHNTLPRAAPIHVGAVGLRARDAERLADWYVQTLGLREIDRAGSTIRLGAEAPLLSITEIAGLRRAGAREAGLYHTAFLLPTRADLGRWVLQAVERDLGVDGAADHLVSEAIYMTDPEGNGVELYADRPQQDWRWTDGKVEMASVPFDAQAVVAAAGPAPARWTGAPAGTMIGHVHLKVGNAADAAVWWQERLGFDEVRRRDGAVFLSTGGYHHHVAVNEWVSAGAGRRPAQESGLDFVELRRSTPAAPAEFTDDWGTVIRVL
ncbi:VOC family protein (plasmid) [Salipiger sp. H15]|uniref:VOC family protein n=1 Tax=Alloyangia sp. H15 TaxID=3029062 RepID=A0AAU8AR16_9RHOB